MAMAAAASTVCVPSPSSSFSAGASSRECPRAAAATVSSAAVPSTAKAAVSATLRPSASSRRPRREWRWQAVAEQLQAADTEENSEEGARGVPSDSLSIFFEAEGTLVEASVAKLTTALEAVEGVSNVDVSAAADGTATVKLTKQMSVQATGVASGLVDVLLKGGFKLQALNLGFDEEDGDDDDFYEYDVASTTEESEVAE